MRGEGLESTSGSHRLQRFVPPQRSTISNPPPLSVLANIGACFPDVGRCLTLVTSFITCILKSHVAPRKTEADRNLSASSVLYLISLLTVFRQLQTKVPMMLFSISAAASAVNCCELPCEHHQPTEILSRPRPRITQTSLSHHRFYLNPHQLRATLRVEPLPAHAVLGHLPKASRE